MKTSPTYRAQCRTFTLARELLGMIRLQPWQGTATPMDHPLTLFRAYRLYRDERANNLRAAVAFTVREQRRITKQV